MVWIFFTHQTAREQMMKLYSFIIIMIQFWEIFIYEKIIMARK